MPRPFKAADCSGQSRMTKDTIASNTKENNAFSGQPQIAMDARLSDSLSDQYF
jgi:hypothetical protein